MPRVRHATAGVAAVMLTAAAIAQQDPAAARDEGAPEDGPIVVGKREELHWLRLGDFRLALDFSVRHRTDDTRGPEGSRRNTELEFRESLELATRGFILHPNFVELELLGRFSPSQRRESGPEFLFGAGDAGTTRWTYEYLTEYDASAHILQQSDTPATVYSRRNQTYLSRTFGETLDITSMEHGLRLAMRSDVMPMQFHYLRSDQDTRSASGLSDFQLARDTFQWSSQFSPSDSQDLQLDYAFDHVVQRRPGLAAFGLPGLTQRFQRHDASAGHNISFGDSNQHNLRSTLHFFKESGTFDVDRLRIQEFLRLRHTPRFETNYNYTFDWTQRPVSTQMINRGSAGFRHRLFESVVTNGNIGASHLSLSGQDFTSTQYFGNLGAQYHKDVLMGRFTAASDFSYTRQEDSRRDGTIQILNEPHTFPASGIITLQRRLIIPGSIIVTDASGTFRYAAGLDYTVHNFVEFVEIRRVVGGQIDDGETVLVRYQIDVEPGRTTDTFGMRFTIRYEFDEGPLAGLGVYARYFQQDQSRTNETDLSLPPADIREIIYGADYRIWHLTLLAERQEHESSISPFRATRAEARYTHPLGRGSSLLAAATWYDIDRYRDDLRSQILSLTGRWNQQLTDNLSFGAQLAWRDERNRGGTSVRGFEQQVDCSWRHRQTTVYGAFRNALLDSDVRRSHFQTLFVGLRREF